MPNHIDTSTPAHARRHPQDHSFAEDVSLLLPLAHHDPSVKILAHRALEHRDLHTKEHTDH